LANQTEAYFAEEVPMSIDIVASRRILFVLLFAFLVFRVPGAAAGQATDVKAEIGPAIGTSLSSLLIFSDQGGAARDFSSLTGKAGLILIFSRSLSWCPYCMNDAREWSALFERVQGMGFGLAVVTYDSSDKLSDFSRRFDIQYPLLSDKGSRAIKALGILNQEHGPGSFAHGIPHPMVFITDVKGVLRYRFSEAHYSERADKNDVLEVAKRLGAN
jgi:peroxiredoxin